MAPHNGKKVNPRSKYADWWKRRNELLPEIYYNDLIMINILQSIPYMDRFNIMLASRRLNSLCRKYIDVRARATLCVRLYLPKKNVDFLVRRWDYKFNETAMIPALFTKFLSPDMKYLSENLLVKYSKTFKEDVIFFRFEGPISPIVLKSINHNFPRVIGLECYSFSKMCLDYLTSGEQTLTTRITDLCFIEDVDMIFTTYCLDLFKNIKRLSYEGRGCSIFHSEVVAYDGVFDTIDLLRYESLREVVDISKKCKELSYCLVLQPYHVHTLHYFGMIKNLSTLKLWLESVPTSEIIAIFKGVNVNTLSCLELQYVVYNDELINLLLPTENSCLKEIELISWKLDTNLSVERYCNTLSPGDIFPKSLKKLTLRKVEFMRKFIKTISERCPLLENISIYTSLDQNDEHFFQQILHKLKYLTSVDTDVYITRKDFQDLVSNPSKIKEITFRFHRVHRANMKKIIDKLSARYEFSAYSLQLYLPINRDALDKVDFSSLVDV